MRHRRPILALLPGPTALHSRATRLRHRRQLIGTNVTPYLKLDHIDKTFNRGSHETEVLRDITLGIEKGEFVSMIGHSGCGKSTLLNILGGLLKSTTGEVFLEGKVVDEPGPPSGRREAVVGHLREQEIGDQVVPARPPSRPAAVDLPVPESEDQDVGEPDQ